jgi:hypothetical protein
VPHWFLHFFGLDSASGTAYLAWSGALSDLGELAIIGGLITVYRKHVCEVRAARASPGTPRQRATMCAAAICPAAHRPMRT